MRRAYAAGPLDPSDLAPTWLAQLERWLAEAIEAQVPEPNAMVLATASTAARPGARTVLLKGLDDRGLVFFTNLRSRKGRELAGNGRAALVFPWIALHRQVVIDGVVESVDAAEADEYFASRPHGARLGALSSPQSEVVASRAELERRYEDLRRRHPEGTDVPRPEWWGGLRVVPEAVEFWLGRPDRMHDRLRFRADDGAWIVERLAP